MAGRGSSGSWKRRWLKLIKSTSAHAADTWERWGYIKIIKVPPKLNSSTSPKISKHGKYLWVGIRMASAMQHSPSPRRHKADIFKVQTSVPNLRISSFAPETRRKASNLKENINIPTYSNIFIHLYTPTTPNHPQPAHPPHRHGKPRCYGVDGGRYRGWRAQQLPTAQQLAAAHAAEQDP